MLTVISIAIQGLGCAATYICSQVSQIWFLLQTTHPFTYIYYDLYRSLWAAVKRLFFWIETLRVLLGQPTYIYYNLLWYFKNDLNRCLKYDLFPGLHHFSPILFTTIFYVVCFNIYKYLTFQYRPIIDISILTNIWYHSISSRCSWSTTSCKRASLTASTSAGLSSLCK